MKSQKTRLRTTNCCLQIPQTEQKNIDLINMNRPLEVTNMELENSSCARRVTLSMQLHFFSLSVLWLQGAATKEVDAVREAQLPAFCVSLKVHNQGLKGAKHGERQRD